MSIETPFPLPTTPRTDSWRLIDQLLAEQRQLTVVERFAEAPRPVADEPAQAKYYRELIPLARPLAGEQYAFTVELDACSGCKACVTACHSLNGLDEGETFRDVGAFAGRDGQGEHVLQHVTTACHHCLEPACLTGCPTRAYDKDPITGIVRHLDDQCIGCQYCTLMCPYEVPKFNVAKGIVRKCDMCRQRLVEGEAPACVQACPNQAIRIDCVRTEERRERGKSGAFLPVSPDPRLTLPTTRFVTRRDSLLDVAVVADAPRRPAHAHLPLVFMLVLTQMSVGMFCVSWVMSWVPSSSTAPLAVLLVAAVIGVAGQNAAVLHLGRPGIAWRAWLGWRTSWLSREIIAFGAFSAVAGTLVAYRALAPERGTFAITVLGAATCCVGLAGVLCSAMIYVATRRPFWNGSRTITRFCATAAMLGPAGVAAAMSLSANEPTARWLVALIFATTVMRLSIDGALFHRLRSGDGSDLGDSAALLVGPLRNWDQCQGLATIVGGILIPLIQWEFVPATRLLPLLSVTLLLLAELMQRGLFFAAVAPPGMPGVRPT